MTRTGLTVILAGLALGNAAARADSCERSGVACLPSLDEHGAVAHAPSVPEPEEVRPAKPPKSDSSRDLVPRATAARASRIDPVSPFDPKDRLFASALDENAASLIECRIDVARTRRVSPVRLPNDTAHLRLWVDARGHIVDSLVATKGALGPAFRDCVKQGLHAWSLPPPRSGRGVLVDVYVRVPAKGHVTVRPAAAPVS